MVRALAANRKMACPIRARRAASGRELGLGILGLAGIDCLDSLYKIPASGKQFGEQSRKNCADAHDGESLAAVACPQGLIAQGLSLFRI